mgnify:CR=1 FL=1
MKDHWIRSEARQREGVGLLDHQNAVDDHWDRAEDRSNQ